MHRCLKIFAHTNEEQVFSSNKDAEAQRAKEEAAAAAAIRKEKEQYKIMSKLNAPSSIEPSSRPTLQTIMAENEKPLKKTLSKEDALAAAAALLEYYQTDEAQQVFRETHREANFDLRPFLRRVKKVVHEMRKPTLRKYGFEEDEDGNNDFEKAINKHSTDLRMKKLTKEIMEAIMGEMNDVHYGKDPAGRLPIALGNAPYEPRKRND